MTIQPRRIEDAQGDDLIEVPLADARAALAEMGIEPGVTVEHVTRQLNLLFPPSVLARIEQPRPGFFVAVIEPCPWCGRRHTHAAGDDGWDAEGARVAHCHPPDRSPGRYRLVVDPESLPDPAELVRERP